MMKQKAQKRKAIGKGRRALVWAALLTLTVVAGVALHGVDSSKEPQATAEQNVNATTQQQEVAVAPVNNPPAAVAQPQPPALSKVERIQRVGALLVDAKRALAEQDYAGASAKAEEALRLDPDSRPARAMKEKILEERQEALEEQRDKQVELFQRQARQALSRSDIPAALAALQEAQKLNPADAGTFRLIERAHVMEHEQEMRRLKENFLKSRNAVVEPEPPAPAKVNWSTAQPAAPEEPNGEYTIQPEDVLQITVYEEPDLSTKVRVSRTGEITFPLLGRVPVAGLTVPQLQEKLTQLLGEDYLVHPQVQVFIETPRNVFVTGEVKHPGSYPLSTEKASGVLELITLAGGFTEDADMNGTRVIRMESGQKQTLRVRVSDIIQKGDKSKDVTVKADDIIFVPESFF